MPRIEHAALWTPDLERARQFYERYFGGRPGPRYENKSKRFSSYFLSFESGSRLELMHRPDLGDAPGEHKKFGHAHLAFSLGSEVQVEELTERLRRDGFVVAGEPRRTGDGYFDSVVLDPDGNRVELTV